MVGYSPYRSSDLDIKLLMTVCPVYALLPIPFGLVLRVADDIVPRRVFIRQVSDDLLCERGPILDAKRP